MRRGGGGEGGRAAHSAERIEDAVEATPGPPRQGGHAPPLRSKRASAQVPKSAVECGPAAPGGEKLVPTSLACVAFFFFCPRLNGWSLLEGGENAPKSQQQQRPQSPRATPAAPPHDAAAGAPAWRPRRSLPRGAVGSSAQLHLVRGPPARGSTRAKYARALHALRASAQPGRAAVSVRSHARAPHAARRPRVHGPPRSLARAPTLLRPQALRGAGPQVPAGRPELFIGGKILDVPAARSARGRRAMLSAFRARRAPLLLTAVLSETWAAKGGGSHFLCHRAISPSLGSPLQSRSLGDRASLPGVLESEEPPRDSRGHFRSRVANAARGSRLRHPPANESLSGDAGGPGCALRLPGSGSPGALVSWVALGFIFAQVP